MKHFQVVLEETKKYFALVEAEDPNDAVDKAVAGDIDSFQETEHRIKVCGTPEAKK